jgi:hypothetical protein
MPTLGSCAQFKSIRRKRVTRQSGSQRNIPGGYTRSSTRAICAKASIVSETAFGPDADFWRGTHFRPSISHLCSQVNSPARNGFSAAQQN